MAKFCVNCGAGLADGARFCPNCGTAVTGQTSVASPPPATAVETTPADMVIGSPVTNTSSAANGPPVTSYAPPTNVAPPAHTGSGVKILFIVLGVIAFLGLLLAGSCFYVAYRVKQKATEFKAEMGGSVPRYTGSRDACGKLSETEVSQAVGQKVTSVESRGSMSCIYHFGPGGQKQIPVEYTWSGGAMAMKLSHGAMKQIAGTDTFTSLPDIGDEAYMEPMNSGLLMRKGDVMVTIDMRVADLNAEAAKAMAKKIAGRL